jgi:hypothetical protein
MEIKISPLLLFLGLFILLALSVYFGKSGQLLVEPDYASTNMESYMTLEYSTAPLQKVVLQSYSPTSSQVYKLFDNLFFDRTNANTIELVGYQKELMGNTDVLAYRIYTPDGFTNQYKYITSGQVLTESTISTIPSTYSSFMVDSVLVSNTAALFPSKQVAVVTWNKDTFITVIHLGNVGSTSGASVTPTMGFMAYFPNSSSASIQQRFYDITNTNGTAPTSQYPIGIRDAGSNSVSDLSDGKSLALTNYDSTKMVYQVCMNVLYDTKNSSIIVKNADGTIVVYTRPTSLGVNPSGATYPDTSSQPAKNTTTTVPSVSYAPWFFITPNNKYLVQYIAWGQNTIVTIFVNRNGLLVVHKCYRFNSDGTIDGDTSVVQPGGSSGNAGANSSNSSNSGNTYSSGSNALSDYYQWLAFWNTVAKSPSTANLSASNLVPKSSIVPPVCPSCPSCSGNTACTNCGGQGGSGTQGASGSGSGSRSLLRDAGSGTANLLRDTGSGTTSLIRDTGSGTAQFAKDTASGTAQFAKDTASGTVGLAKDTVGGAVGLAKDTVGGVASMFGVQNPTQVQSGATTSGGSSTSQSSPGVGTSTAYQQTIPGSDPYSYFGAVPPKGANYIPITASFSAFSK